MKWKRTETSQCLAVQKHTYKKGESSVGIESKTNYESLQQMQRDVHDSDEERKDDSNNSQRS